MSPIITITRSFDGWDIAALSWLLVASIGVGLLIENPPARHPSVAIMMMRLRREWMMQFLHRDPRIFDGNILASLRESTAFFASATMIAIGGGLALLGNSDQISTFAQQLDLGDAPAIKWEVKIIVALLFVFNAFLRFVWSNRLFGYCAILMGAVPVDPAHPMAVPRAMQAADLNIRAARNFNAGLRGVYFAIGALSWLAGPFVLAAVVAIVTYLTWWREFASGSRKVLLAGRRYALGVQPGQTQHDQAGQRKADPDQP